MRSMGNNLLTVLFSLDVVNIVLGIIAGIIIFGLIQEGLQQLKKEAKNAYFL